MIFLSFKAIAIVILLFYSGFSFARCDSYDLTMYPKNTIVNNLPANGVVPGSPLLDSNMSIWKVNGDREFVFDMRWGGCAGNVFGMGRAYMDPLGKVIPNVYYKENGKIYTVFDTGVPGIGYAIGVRDYKADLSKEIPLRNYTVQTYPYSGSSGVWVTSIGYRARLIFVATRQSFVSGKYVIPAQKVANFWALGFREGGGDAPRHAKLHLSTTSLTIEAQGCQYNSPERQLVTMPTISRDFKNDEASDYAANFSVSVTCDPNVSVYATMTDVHHPDSTGNILNGSPSSTAKGIGLQIYKNNDATPINLGPDSPHQGSINQWYVGGSKNTPQTTHIIPFKVQYIKLPEQGDIVSGIFHAEASITFSYQ